MARTIADTTLSTRAARGRLQSRNKPYFRALEPGLHLGYRKPVKGAGKWLARHYVGGERYETETLGIADDYSDADGVAILSYKQAQDAARARMVDRAHAAAGKGPYTVAAATGDYLDYIEGRGQTTTDARYRIDALILPELGETEVSALTTDRLRKWHAGLAKVAARLRTRPGEDQRFRELADDDDAIRRRRASANRTLTVLKAALNHAWREGKVASDDAWRRAAPFEAVEAARVRWLTIAEAKRLVNACPPDFRRLVQGALETGARYSE
jgi:hypothetical protein